MKLYLVEYGFKTMMSLERTPDIDNKTFVLMIKEMVTEVDKKMDLVFKEYKSIYDKPVSNASSQSESVVEQVAQGKRQSKFMSMFHKDGGSSGLQSSTKPMMDGFDILQWGKVNPMRYPVVSNIARCKKKYLYNFLLCNTNFLVLLLFILIFYYYCWIYWRFKY